MVPVIVIQREMNRRLSIIEREMNKAKQLFSLALTLEQLSKVLLLLMKIAIRLQLFKLRCLKWSQQLKHA